MAIGNAVIYLFGLPRLAAFVGLDRVINLGFLPFIPGDMVKLLLVAALLPGAGDCFHCLDSRDGGSKGMP